MQPATAIRRGLLQLSCAALLLAAAMPARRPIGCRASAGSAPKWARLLRRPASWAPARSASSSWSVPPRISAALPAGAKGAVLAAHATPEGHWKFANRDGDVFTAGTPEELQRVVPTLLPDATPGGSLGIYLSEDTLFADRALLKDLPPGAKLYVVAGADSYPLVARGGEAGVGALYAAVRPNLHRRVARALAVRRGHRAARASAQPLQHPHAGAGARRPRHAVVVSAARSRDEGGAGRRHRSAVAWRARCRRCAGKRCSITGRVDDNLLYFRPSSGTEQSVKLSELTRAAADNDVNLVILHAEAPRQPGGRNWLWQRIAVGGLDDALKRATFGDFLDALGAARGEFRVSMQREPGGRVAIRAVPADADAEPITGVVGDWWTSAVSNVTGNVVTSAVEVHARDEERQKELDRRLIPHIPSWYQFAYLAGLIAGVLGWPVASEWYARIWPPEERAEYGTTVGYRAAQAVRLLAYLLVFLPLAGVPALIASFDAAAVGAWRRCRCGRRAGCPPGPAPKHAPADTQLSLLKPRTTPIGARSGTLRAARANMAGDPVPAHNQNAASAPMATLLLTHPAFTQHDTGAGHPERARPHARHRQGARA